VVERFGGDKVADKCDSFSVYIFGRATKDEDVLKVGYVLEQMTRVREKLEPYMAPRTEIADVVAS
jgi:amidase